MENNNFNFSSDNKEGLPIFNPNTPLSSQSDFNFIPYEQENLNQQPILEDRHNPEIDDLVDEAFSKALTSTIMAVFPITSIIAIFFSSKSKKLIKEAETLARKNNYALSGKIKAAKILSTIGTIAGLVLTGYYLIEFFAVLIAVFSSFVALISSTADLAEVLFDFAEFSYY